MKKIVFAVQVIGLIAMLPIVVVLEMNHITGKMIGQDFPAGVTKKAENTIIPSTGKLTTNNEEEMLNLFKNTKLLKTFY